MALKTCPVDPTVLVNATNLNDLGFDCRPGDCFEFQHPTLGQWVVRAVKFLNAVTYAAGQPVQFCDALRTTVTNDIAGGATATIGVAAGICLGIQTQNKYAFILAKGAYATVLTNGDDDIALGDQIIIGASDGVCDSATTLTGKHLGFAYAADVDSDNTVAAIIDCQVD